MPPPKKQTKKRTDIDSIEVPVWLKPGKAVWQETYDQSGNSVVGFSKLIVETMDEKTKKVRLMTEDNSPETEAYMDEVFDRAENPQIKDDLVDIDPLNDAELLRCLEIRFRKDLIYCFCGPTLLATNPYKIIKEAQSPDVLQMFQNYALKGGEKIKQPHIWNTASQVFLDLFSTQKKQAICISGESGAGKTVGTKLCLNFMATLVDAAKKDPSKEQPARGLLIGDKILSCNPILESFGNAKTVRNDNSSRFGKYFTISIDPSDKQIKGAEIKNYLLEKSRVVGQSKSERNYHIFYGILRFMPPDDIVKYKFNNDGNVAKASKYLYLNRSESEQSPIVGIDDKELFNDTSSSFPTFLFTSGEISAIWKTLSCVLNLGNIELNQKEVHGKLNCSLSDSQYLTNVIDLLQVKQQALSEGICMKKRDIQGHFILSARSPAQSESIKDALAKEMYNSLFIWIIKKLNFTLLPSIPHPGKQASFMTVGLLDIFGFEDFDSNSLEQFCINYTNEKLQNLYISYVFKAERLLFEQEGLGNYAYMIKFEDNIPIIELIDKKPLGIFYLLNSVAKTAKDDGKDDEKLMDQIQKNHSNSSYLSYDKLKQDIFAVRHVAKKVIYTSGGFVEKNKDELPMNLLEVIDTADKYMVRIFRKVLIEKEDVVSKSTDPDDKFLTHKFRNEMQSLMEELESSNCSFIRCLKPNEVGQSDYWVSSLVLNQIRYLGVLDSIKIRREAVPIRKSYKEFYSQFHDLDLVSPERLVPFITIKDKNLDWKVLSKNLMISVSKEVQPNDAIFGNNKIFMGIKFVHFLEKQLDVALKAKRIASEKIAKSFVIYRITNEWNKLRRKISLSIKMSKVILINWNSKISYVKLKKLISIVTRMQRQFRMTLYKRGIRIQKFSTMVIGRSFRLFQIKKVLFKVNLLQRLMVNLKQRMAHKRAIFRLRVCKKLTEELYESTWKAVERKHQAVASITIQRIFRGYLSSVKYTYEVDSMKLIRFNLRSNSYAILVQKHIRGFIVRVRLDRYNRAAWHIQGHLRMCWLKKYFGMYKKNIKVIQSFMKRYLIKLRKIKEKGEDLLEPHKEYMNHIKIVEHSILFKKTDKLLSYRTLVDFIKTRFFEENLDFMKKIPKIESFVPPIIFKDLKPKMKMFSVLIDFDFFCDTSDVYKRSWAVDYLNLTKRLNHEEARMMHLEVGGSFSLAITDDLKVFSWGMNDFLQLGRRDSVNNDSHVHPKQLRSLGKLAPRIISGGDDHCVMVDYNNEAYIWGRNQSAELGLGHSEQIESIVKLKKFGNQVRFVAAKGRKSYFVLLDGSVYCIHADPGRERLKPVLTRLIHHSALIQSVSCGRDFAVGLSQHGILFSVGGNRFGQLGVGDTFAREEFTLVDVLRDYGERVVQTSCGNLHSICRTSSGKIFTWGLNSNGQLGIGNIRNSLMPIMVSGKGGNTTFKAVSVQGSFCTSYVLVESTRVYVAGKQLMSKKESLFFKEMEYKKSVIESL